MSLENYGDLLAAVTDWMARDDVAGSAADFVRLGEARLNRELQPLEMWTTLNGASGSRILDISSLSCKRPIALFLARVGLNETELTPKAPGTFPIVAVPGLPRYWARESDGEIGLDRELDGDYPFRFRFAQEFRLSEEAPTNWLLTNHPDVYLAATLVWGGVYIRDASTLAQFQSTLNAGIPSVRNFIAQSKRGALTVDPMLQRIGQPLRGTYNAANIEWP